MIAAPITIACVWVRGNVPYPREYVANLSRMTARAMSQPYRFVCLTDRPADLPREVEPIVIPAPAPLDGWWAKIRLFDPSLGLTGRILYLDLDTLIVAPLAPILEWAAPFALIPHAGEFNGRPGRAVVKRFNSSVMVWDAGATEQLFARWTPAAARRLWGDQDWIGEQQPEAGQLPAAWFPRISEVAPPLPAAAKIILAKKPKNHEAAARWPWVDAIWRAA